VGLVKLPLKASSFKDKLGLEKLPSLDLEALKKIEAQTQSFCNANLWLN
jgi:hypothetical protein